jgi:uncharacterized membrane protein YgdD (TMEM256/DUF423 family)
MQVWLFIGAVNGFLGIAAGAFGAHGLESRVDARALEIFNTGAHYHLIHALATVAAALIARGAASGRARMAALLFTAGVVFFSGSLYFMALAGSNALVLATPIGGLCFLAGWAMLAAAALKPQG